MENEELEVNPEVNFEADGSEEDEYEVFLSDQAPPAEPESEDPLDKMDQGALKEELRKLRAEMEALKPQADSSQAIQRGIAELGQSLQRPAYTPPYVPQAPVESEEAFMKRFNETYIDNPYQANQEFILRKLQPEMQRFYMNNLKSSRRWLEINEQRQHTAKRYMAEIEQEVSQMPVEHQLFNLDVFTEAHDRVVARHYNEIVKEEVERALKEAGRSNPPAAARPPGFQERPSMNGGQKKKIAVQLTPQEEAAWRISGGGTKEEYAEWLIRSGKKKVR